MALSGGRRALLAGLAAAAVAGGGIAAATLPSSGSDQAPAARPADELVIATVGDHGTDPRAEEVLAAIGRSDPDLVLSLGDLAYDEGPGVAQRFCQMVKDSLNRGAGESAGSAYGEELPFAVVEGNHDDDELPQYLAPDCLPDRLGVTPSGLDDLGQAWWVDLPKQQPLVRLVALPSEGQKYGVGTRRHQWLSDVLDGARAEGVPWVVVAQHENYITAGEKPDEIGAEVFDLLVSKQVDLVLQGHDHTYQRSVQLRHAVDCPSVPAGRFEPACVTDDGSDGAYTAGAGTVLLINGTGGRSNYDVSRADPDAPWFPVVMGANTEDASGFSRLTIDRSALEVTYEQAAGDEPFTDAFRITRGQRR